MRTHSVVVDLVWRDIFEAYNPDDPSLLAVLVRVLKDGYTLRDWKGRVFRYFG